MRSTCQSNKTTCRAVKYFKRTAHLAICRRVPCPNFAQTAAAAGCPLSKSHSWVQSACANDSFKATAKLNDVGPARSMRTCFQSHCKDNNTPKTLVGNWC